jgi:Sec-independent protein secretion pathway component TatC
MADPAQPDTTALPPAEEDSGGKMSFFEHLVDLRKRLINSAVAIALGACIGLLVSKHFIVILVKPMQDALRASHFDDKLYFSGFIISSMFLFLCGIAFGYFVMLPQTLRFLINFATDAPVKPLINYNEYFELILIILVGLGVIFELPVLIFILSLFGIVTPKFLLKNFRYAMLVITIVAAVVTPTPDATTMLVFMAPMIALYFIGVLVSYVVLRRKESQTLAGGEAP